MKQTTNQTIRGGASVMVEIESKSTQSLKLLLDAYGVAVRAGVITPQKADEAEFRKLFGLPEMSPAIEADWDSTAGIRKPTTLKLPKASQDMTMEDAE